VGFRQHCMHSFGDSRYAEPPPSQGSHAQPPPGRTDSSDIADEGGDRSVALPQTHGHAVGGVRPPTPPARQAPGHRAAERVASPAGREAPAERRAGSGRGRQPRGCRGPRSARHERKPAGSAGSVDGRGVPRHTRTRWRDVTHGTQEAVQAPSTCRGRSVWPVSGRAGRPAAGSAQRRTDLTADGPVQCLADHRPSGRLFLARASGTRRTAPAGVAGLSTRVDASAGRR
jgi:hypothetical protein